MSYKEIVQEIASLDWAAADPKDIILLSHCTAQEFSQSLRLARKVYPDDVRLEEMMAGELQTDNMTFGDYVKKGDHWEFLDHFVRNLGMVPHMPGLEKAMEKYLLGVASLSAVERSMTVFSREEELTGIFEKILAAHDWEALGYEFYKYYLKQHIFFDSGDNGHAWLTKHFPIHEDVLEKFYKDRFTLYRSLFSRSV